MENKKKIVIVVLSLFLLSVSGVVYSILTDSESCVAANCSDELEEEDEKTLPEDKTILPEDETILPEDETILPDPEPEPPSEPELEPKPESSEDLSIDVNAIVDSLWGINQKYAQRLYLWPPEEPICSLVRLTANKDVSVTVTFRLDQGVLYHPGKVKIANDVYAEAHKVDIEKIVGTSPIVNLNKDQPQTIKICGKTEILNSGRDWYRPAFVVESIDYKETTYIKMGDQNYKKWLTLRHPLKDAHNLVVNSQEKDIISGYTVTTDVVGKENKQDGIVYLTIFPKLKEGDKIVSLSINSYPGEYTEIIKNAILQEDTVYWTESQYVFSGQLDTDYLYLPDYPHIKMDEKGDELRILIPENILPNAYPSETYFRLHIITKETKNMWGFVTKESVEVITRVDINKVLRGSAKWQATEQFFSTLRLPMFTLFGTAHPESDIMYGGER